MASISRESAFLVFSQAPSEVLDVAASSAHAVRFFGTRLESAVDGRVMVAPDGARAGSRLVVARPREAEDLALAERADAAGSGLALLARRCPTVWLVARESSDDGLALRLAAILASSLLGPILDARGPEIFGVKTARSRL